MAPSLFLGDAMDLADEILRQSILFIVSFAANLFASVSGGGAGFVQFPLLILLGLPFATALGTHKVAVVFLGVGALLRKRRSGGRFVFDRQVALIMTLLGAPAVVMGSLIIIKIPSHIAEVVLGVITIAAGIYSFFKKSFGSVSDPNRSALRLLAGSLAVILIGLFSGSLSSGAGLFATMTLVGIFRLDLKSAILHSMVFVATLWNAIGAVTVGMATSIHWHWIPVMVVATLMGSYLGTTLLIKLPVKRVKLIFSMVAVLSGLMLIYAAFTRGS